MKLILLLAFSALAFACSDDTMPSDVMDWETEELDAVEYLDLAPCTREGCWEIGMACHTYCKPEPEYCLINLQCMWHRICGPDQVCIDEEVVP